MEEVGLNIFSINMLYFEKSLAMRAAEKTIDPKQKLIYFVLDK